MTIKSAYLSVVTLDYLPQALTMFESAQSFDKNSQFYCFVVDAPFVTISLLKEKVGVDFAWINFFGYEKLISHNEVFKKLLNIIMDWK